MVLLLMNWIDVEKELPTTDPKTHTVTAYVIVQDIYGGSPRNHYHIEMTTFTNMNRQYGEYWGVKEGIVRYWKPMDEMPEDFKSISGLEFWEKDAWKKEED